jgi:uncharacterized protein (DUF2235 family)
VRAPNDVFFCSCRPLQTLAETVALAYSIYKTPEKLIAGQSLSDAFKCTFSREVRVHFVGVWDTVSSVGALWPRTLPFAGGSNYISVFRHACALVRLHTLLLQKRLRLILVSIGRKTSEGSAATLDR